MATYNKRGYKSKVKQEKEIEETPQVNAEEMDSTTAEVFNTLDDTANKTEQFVEKNQKYILGLIGVLVVAAIGVMAYTKFVKEPNEKEASTSMFFAQQYFNNALNASGQQKDSLYNLALKGGEGNFGFLDIIENYNGTKTANLANYNAGMAYLEMRNYQKAVEYLDQFESDDMILGALAKGNIGDAFSQLGQFDDAMKYYKQAIDLNSNDFTTPLYLFKAGMLAKELKNYDEALGYFNRIKEDFPDSKQAKTVEPYIALVENLK